MIKLSAGTHKLNIFKNYVGRRIILYAILTVVNTTSNHLANMNEASQRPCEIILE